MAYDVFISYSSKNLDVVNALRTALHRPGVTHVFAAEYSVLPGQALNDEIEQAIRVCDLFVLLWNRDARASDYVPQEIGIAKGCKRMILPVVMEAGVPIPAFISNLKYLDAHKDWDGSFKRLQAFVEVNAKKLQGMKALGAIAAIIFGGVILSSK